MIISPSSLDTPLENLLNNVNEGKIQLPDFQRSWTWDDSRIIGIISSISQGYPMGAIMQLAYGNKEIKFKYRPIEGATINKDVVPSFLILDGQQRITSVFQSIFLKKPVVTQNEKHKNLQRYYYLNIDKCLDENIDRVDAVISVPEDKKIKENFNRDTILDLSTRELEQQQGYFPLNIVFDATERENWLLGYLGCAPDNKDKYLKFRADVIQTIEKYKLPVITLDEKTPREAVCKVFENVNTGGVALTVFELVTATFATYEFDLRKDWEESKKQIRGTDEQLKSDVLDGIDETAYLTAVTLYASYQAKLDCGKAVSCKKKDVLGLPYQSYLSCKDKVISGFKMARKFLLMQYIFRKKDVPYTTQIIPLSVICATIGQSVFDRPDTQKIIEKWFWCGILGEMYGGANETRYANDVEDVIAEVKGQPSQYRTINSSYFSATRLLSLNTRGSAAYKGIMALIYKNQCRDFCKGTTMNLVISMDERPDIHHIFPQDYCKAQGFPETKWDCIINKTPLLPQSNRSIGGDAPSIYTKNIMKKVNISETELKTRIETNLVNYDLLVSDNFDEYFIDRAKKLLVLIDNAMGKQVADRGSENVIQKYGQSLQ